jgi:two-component system sensor histidine kinase HydH
LRTPESNALKILALAGVTVLTLGVHYGWLIEPIFGHVHWIHAVHGRFCYIPIVMAASWFGIRGGLYAATAISVLVLPYVFIVAPDTQGLAGELAEIIFYYAIATLIGVLVEREFKARKKQQEAQLQAERSHELSLVGQIAAGVAHEVKNPLASIKGAADILTDDETLPAEREEFKAILRNEIKRIDTTITEFLSFARPKKTKLERLNLSEVLRTSLRQTEAEGARRGIRIESDLEEDIYMNGDPEKLHQMTLNLILNAIQASKPDDAITFRLKTDSSNSVRLTIRDAGVGIDAVDLRRVFEPFFTTRSSGTGLGLAIVKEIIDSHSGEISIESTKGAGTTMTVTLPLYEESYRQ